MTAGEKGRKERPGKEREQFRPVVAAVSNPLLVGRTSLFGARNLTRFVGQEFKTVEAHAADTFQVSGFEKN